MPTRFISKISGNGRYFLDQNGAPLLVRGDAPWSAIGDLTTAQMTTYLQTRAGQGYNAVLVSAICGPGNGGPHDNGATYDEVHPFLDSDITRPNPTYWARLDHFVSTAAAQGITCILYAIDGWSGQWGGVLDNRSLADLQTYGAFIANRYASATNIVWASGGDYTPNATTDAEFDAVLQGIRSTGDKRPFTMQFNAPEGTSIDTAYWESRCDFSFDYTYSATYRAVRKAYDHTWSKHPIRRPSLFSEGTYLGELNRPEKAYRAAIAQAITSGSPGDIWGTSDWQFLTDWQNRLSDPAIGRIKVLRDFVESIAWHSLVPSDSFVTAGVGTKIAPTGEVGPHLDTYAPAAVAPNGTLALVYVPEARSITVDTAQVGTGFTAQWVDPVSGAKTSAGSGPSFTNSTTKNAGGVDSDRLLLITSTNVRTRVAVAPKATAWRRQLAKRESNKTVIGSLGDSHTESVGATMGELGWTALTARALARDIAEGQSLGGTSISPRAPQAVNLSGAYATEDARQPHFVRLDKASGTTAAGVSAFYDLYAYTFIDVFYVRITDENGPYSRKPEYRINGGAWQTFSTPENVLFEPGVAYCTSRIENWPGGTLELRAPADAPHAEVFQIIAHRGWNADLGVKWINFARSGYTSGDVKAKLQDYLVAEPLKALPFDLLHLGLGANDVAAGTSVATTKQNIRDIISWYHTNVRQVPVLFTISPFPDLLALGTSVTQTAWNATMDGIVAVAAEYPDSMVVDLRGIGKQSETLDLYLPAPDDHFNNAGHRLISNAVYDVLKP
ncbi:apiosidase-like domain-containing protein [Rhodococcus sp. NPDC003994]